MKDASVKSPSRRRLLKYGLAGAVVLAVVPLLVGRREKKLAQGYKHLRDADLAMWQAVAPVMLAGSLPADAAQRQAVLAEVIYRLDAALDLLRPSLRTETLQLFDFLQMSAVRGLSTGVWRDWAHASPEQVQEILEDWSRSSVKILRIGFRTLRTMAQGAWYGMPQSWPGIGYPGPPNLAGAAS